jgi:hypothetical protein
VKLNEKYPIEYVERISSVATIQNIGKCVILYFLGFSSVLESVLYMN